MPLLFDRVTIVGVGLIGGSLGGAIRSRKLAKEVIGFGRSGAHLERARKLQLIDRWTLDLEEGCCGAPLVILCAPPEDVVRLGTRILGKKWLGPGAILSDVAGVKGPIVSSMMRVPGGRMFVGAHPMAGRERSGFEHADPALFEGRICAVTPVSATGRRAFRTVSRFWRCVGARVIEMSPGEHDRHVALISHLPHALSFAYTDLVSRSKRRHAVLRLAAGSFQDMTRISAGPPEMWASLLRLNRRSVVAALAPLIHRLRNIERWLKNDPRKLDRFLRDVSTRRHDWS